MATKTGKKNKRGGIQKVGLNTKDESGNFVLPSEQKKVASYTTTGGEKKTQYRDTRTGARYSTADSTSASDALLRKGNAMLEQTKAEGNKQFKGSSYDTGFEPTTISDTNVREKYIPEIDSKINKYAETGQYYDANGNLHNADGTISETKDTTQDSAYSTGSSEADGLMTSANADSKLIFDTLDTLMKQTDKDTASQIQSIKAQYDIREKQLEEINRREQMGEATSLLLGGSSRYAGSASGIMAGYQRADIMELAELDAKEMSAISEAKAAQSEKNYNLASKKLDYVETLRKEKVTKATEIAKAIAEENKKTREAQIKMTREAAIADMFQQGITDPAEMLGLIAEQGGDITLKEINDTLKIIDPDANLAGASSDYKTYKMMQKAGEIPSGWNFFDYKVAIKNATGGGSNTDTNIGNFDYTDAKTQDIKERVKNLFPGDFGSKLILELTDEELREFMTYYENKVAETGQSRDPENELVDWSSTMGVNVGTDDLASQIDALFN